MPQVKLHESVASKDIPSADADMYHRLNVAILFLNHLLAELSNGFSDSNCTALKGISIFPMVMKAQFRDLNVVGQKRSYNEAFSSSVHVPEQQNITFATLQLSIPICLLNMVNDRAEYHQL